MNELDRFFHPDSVAIIGVSEALTSYGTRYIQALLDFGYEGRIYAVNHSGTGVGLRSTSNTLRSCCSGCRR